MKTPIYDFLVKYSDKETTRLHMPGGKGKVSINPISICFPFDITEIKGADSLYDADGIILQSETNTAALYGSLKTIFSTGGSTLCIQTMLKIAAPVGSTVVAARNSHKAFVNSCGILDLNVSWILPKDDNGNYLSYSYTVKEVEDGIKAADNPSCVYITSPDYYGRMAPIKEISNLCKRYNLPLLVDNAHGAHLKFLEKSLHPIDLGADLCCDSAHKMLPVLTGGAYLHINASKYLDIAKDSMGIFGSTSPSYLTLCSLDICNKYLDEGGSGQIKAVAKEISDFKLKFSPPYTFIDSEPLRMTIDAAKSGLNGKDLAENLRENNIECEYADDGYVVLLFSPVNDFDDFERLESALRNVKMPKIRIQLENEKIIFPIKKMSIREAMFAENETISVDDSAGRICGIVKISCPPGVAIVAPGEEINGECINILKRYSNFKINVVK